MEMASAAETEAVHLLLDLLIDVGKELAAVRLFKSPKDFRILLTCDYRYSGDCHSPA